MGGFFYIKLNIIDLKRNNNYKKLPNLGVFLFITMHLYWHILHFFQ